jgi:hypothetical protein
MAILQEAKSQFVAKVHGWFDQTIDRVSSRFTVTARIITFVAALIIAVTVQLDTFALVNRLSVDDQFRDAVKAGAQKVVDASQKASETSSEKSAPSATASPTPPNAAGAPTPASSPTAAPAATATPSSSNAATPSTSTPPSSNAAATGNTPSSTSTPVPTTASVQKDYYNLLSTAGLVTLPTDFDTWWDKWTLAKVPGILLSALLLSLGAPFWYGRLQDLLKLRSSIAQNDATQRCIRQTTQAPGDGSGTPTAVVNVGVGGEQGDINAVG